MLHQLIINPLRKKARYTEVCGLGYIFRYKILALEFRRLNADMSFIVSVLVESGTQVRGHLL